VLRSVYGLNTGEIAAALRALLDTGNVALHRSAAEAGLMMLEAGGDFSDGVIAHEGLWLGGEVFVSFDQRSITLLRQQGLEARSP
jgi:predicted nucleic-acid-binding protein